MAIDKDELSDRLWDIIGSEARSMLTLAWDGDGPAHSGFVEIIAWRDMFFMRSSDYEPEGPFDELSEALDLDQFSNPSPKPALVSKELPLEALLKVALGVIDDGDHVDINGKSWNKEGIEETLASGRHRARPLGPRR